MSDNLQIEVGTLFTVAINGDRTGYRVVWEHFDGKRCIGVSCDENGAPRGSRYVGIRQNRAGNWVLDTDRRLQRHFTVTFGHARNYSDPHF